MHGNPLWSESKWLLNIYGSLEAMQGGRTIEQLEQGASKSEGVSVVAGLGGIEGVCEVAQPNMLEDGSINSSSDPSGTMLAWNSYWSSSNASQLLVVNPKGILNPAYAMFSCACARV